MIIVKLYIHIIFFYAFTVKCVPIVDNITLPDSTSTNERSFHDNIAHSNENLNNISNKTKVLHNTIKDNVTAKGPVDELSEITKNIASEMHDNPYFKLPQLDRKIREIALLHPTIMEKVGVYVVSINEEHGEETNLSDDKLDYAQEDWNNIGDIKKSDINDILQKTEMTKAMTPEEKLDFIPHLKETIIYEILKSKDELKNLCNDMANKHNFQYNK